MVHTMKITPRPPFYLFVPSIYEIPEDLKKQNKGKAFVFGHFYDTDEKATKEVKDAGYDKTKIRILKSQGYFRLRGEW